MDNKTLTACYPFLKWYGDPLFGANDENEEPDAEYTWEDEIPKGWRKAFCPRMWDELKAILEKANYVDKFRFVQIKEKYAALRIYDEGVPDEIDYEFNEWKDKYEALSLETCIYCGAPSTHYTRGWILPLCDNCDGNIRR